MHRVSHIAYIPRGNQSTNIDNRISNNSLPLQLVKTTYVYQNRRDKQQHCFYLTSFRLYKPVEFPTIEYKSHVKSKTTPLMGFNNFAVKVHESILSIEDYRACVVDDILISFRCVFLSILLIYLRERSHDSAQPFNLWYAY